MQHVQDHLFDDAIIRKHARTFEWQDATMKTILVLT